MGLRVRAPVLPKPTPTILDPAHRILADLIKALRLEFGQTQVDLAARLGVSQSYVSKLESGELRVDLIEARALSEALGLSLGALVERLEARIGEARDAT